MDLDSHARGHVLRTDAGCRRLFSRFPLINGDTISRFLQEEKFGLDAPDDGHQPIQFGNKMPKIVSTSCGLLGVCTVAVAINGVADVLVEFVNSSIERLEIFGKFRPIFQSNKRNRAQASPLLA
jgi:hypothetical protein